MMLIAAGVLGMAAVTLAGPPIRTEVNRGPAAAAIHDDLVRRAAQDFGGAIIVEMDGEIVLKAGYGWADREHRVGWSPSTIAQVGSLTKQFTAAAIVDLGLQGKLKFSDPLSTYLKDVPAKTAGITLQELLTHTAGLPDACGDDFDRVSREDLTKRCLAGLDPSPPGTFAYSNLGYSLLAAVVETVSGKSLEEYLSQRFFSPLHMGRTGYFFSPALHDSLARGYDGDTLQTPISDRLQPLGPDFWNLKGNGGMQASAEDMVTWYRALASSPVIGEAMRRTLFTPYVRREDGVSYGYGWFLRPGESGEVEQISHTGSDGVFFSAFVWRPGDKTFYYLVTNSGEKGGAEVASSVLRTLRSARPGPGKPGSGGG